jgi:hypothetical protein
MKKPIRESYINDEEFHEALIIYGKNLQKNKKMTLVTFALDEADNEKFKQYCRETGQKKSVLLREFVKNIINPQFEI